MLSTPAVPPPPPEERERFRDAALATLRRQHERLVWAWREEKGGEPPPCIEEAAQLLARQNERLLSLRFRDREETARCRDDLARISPPRPCLARYARDKLKGLVRRLRGR